MSGKPLIPYDHGNDPPLWEHDITVKAEWTKIDRFPCLDEFVRGVSLYRTKTPAPLSYRVVVDNKTGFTFRIPSTIYDPRQFNIRFGNHLVEFGFLVLEKVQGWHQELPLPSNLRIFRSNPDFVLWSLNEP